ncbi:MAG: methyltransferase domain-containing protein [Anaerolineales bacterium]|nr:methyltransferase domain-containing protein [Anaerolineales bacterium]
MVWIGFILLIIIIGLAVWQIWIAEGAHLGQRFVVWLYEISAPYYDRIKKFDFDWERRFLGGPINEVIASLPDARLLDVGAGTGRIARTLHSLISFRGRTINLEPSRRMLLLGRSLTNSEAALWVQGYAVPLPFRGDSFDIVTCLELLEFTPKPRVTLSELVRVLHPGGWLIVSNRIGWEARWIFGRTFPSDTFPSVLEGAGLQDITIYRWQVNYDLAWARKPLELSS